MKLDLAKRLRTFWANPVVTRDLRGRMRGSKSYWQQTFYLLLLGLLSILGYGTSVGWGGNNGSMNAVDVQRNLQGFYYFIFVTLAVLVTLISPALTAISITNERQRQSLDLLVTTPLSAAEMLIGKMISSVAFLLLLLSLSIPASALCVILGGATLGDVVRVYALLAIDGLVLAAIGLAISCAARTGPAALVWSYIIVVAFLIVTLILTQFGESFGAGSSSVCPIVSLCLLNPFVAVFAGSSSLPIPFQTASLPLCLGSAAFAFLISRAMITAGTYRLGRYGGRVVGSLRRQILLITAVLSGCISYSVFQRMGVFGAGSSTDTAPAVEVILVILFMASAVFLPLLFVPAAASEDDPPGTPIGESYSLRNAFRAVHSGALPYYHIWIIVLTISVAAGAQFAGSPAAGVWKAAVPTMIYLSALGYLFWSLSRLTATLLSGVTASRAVSFVFFATLAWLPIAALGLMYVGQNGDDMNQSPVAWLWIFYPLLKVSTDNWANDTSFKVLAWSCLLCYVLGTIAYLPWQSVAPGGRKKGEHVGSRSRA